ncbi:Protein fam72a [Chytriomyces hyalinus]|nr:Protein fam72a [Chytriomyces hyalinus]
MKVLAILLGNTKVELYSTDSPPTGVQLVFDDYTTPNCQCRIRDVACLGCGNVVGYHVTMPCGQCLESCNNGHFWMFQSEEVDPIDRFERDGTKTLRWANVKCPLQDQAEAEDGATSVETVLR